jgi:adenosylcobinamide-phosphate synthase
MLMQQAGESHHYCSLTPPRQPSHSDSLPLSAQTELLLCALGLDFLLGDPPYALHPVRVMGRVLGWLETLLRRVGADGYVGGVLLFVFLGLLVAGLPSLLILKLPRVPAMLVHVFLLYSLLAFGDLMHHANAVLRAGSLEEARQQLSRMVGRDTAQLEHDAVHRAVIESVAENFVDGFLTPLLFYVFAGLPGLLLFKVASTMDSMVGYRNERYLRFGWCGARMDDVCNWLPARLCWLLFALLAALLPGFHGRHALLCGWQQHALLPSPNSGWSEAAMAGALHLRLLGPIRKRGELVTNVWMGPPESRAGATHEDVLRAQRLLWCAALSSSALLLAYLTFWKVTF